MTLWRLFHALRRILRGPAASRAYQVGQHSLAFVQAQWLVRAFYLATLIVAFETGKTFYEVALDGGLDTPLWPIFWVRWLPEELAVGALVIGLFTASLFAVLAPHLRTVRIAVFLLVLMTVAGELSFGYFKHYLHFWIWLSLVFVFFPLTKAMPPGALPGPARRHLVVSWFFAAQVMIGIFYSLSGFWKAVRGVVVPEGNLSSFHPDALPSLVMELWIYGERPTLLSDLFLQHLWIGWPGHLLVIYFELFALVAVFRPEMHRLFGSVLIAFHMSVWLLMGIHFPYQPVALALLFVFSPFAVGRRYGFGTFLYQLPLFGDLAALLRPAAPSQRRAKPKSLGAAS